MYLSALDFHSFDLFFIRLKIYYCFHLKLNWYLLNSPSTSLDSCRKLHLLLATVVCVIRFLIFREFMGYLKLHLLVPIAPKAIRSSWKLLNITYHQYLADMKWKNFHLGNDETLLAFNIEHFNVLKIIEIFRFLISSLLTKKILDY